MTNQLVSRGRRLSGRIGWGIILGVNLIIVLLLERLTPGALSPEIWLAILVGVLLLVWLALLTGIVLLIVGYPDFFRQPWGVLIFLGLFALAVRLSTSLQVLESAGWLQQRLLLVAGVWGLTLPAAVAIVLAVYLWRRDHSVQVAAVTFLVVVWLLVAYTRLRGPAQVLQDAVLGNFPGEFFALICFSQLIFVLAPLFFIGHSLRLLHREWTRADMDVMFPRLPDQQPEEVI